MVKRTKIIATIGPASDSRPIIKKLVKAGVNVVRLNFSHGTYEQHQLLIRNVRAVAKELQQPVAIMQDLQGPRLRIGNLPSPDKILKNGQIIWLSPQEKFTQHQEITIPIQAANLASQLKSGKKILIDEGLVELRVKSIKGKDIQCLVKIGGKIGAHKSINLPDTQLKIPAITPKDIKDLEFGIKNNIDWVALSFVKHANDLIRLKKIITNFSSKYLPQNKEIKKQWRERVRVVAKIERPEAVKNITKIIAAADAIMVARGDLGIELSPENVPLVQKDIIRQCNQAACPVIVATQMLESMVENPIPTRAEMSDIENAILDGADAVMLSAETASGKYPIESVKFMAQAAKKIEEYWVEQRPYLDDNHQIAQLTVAQAAGSAAVKLAEDLKGKLIVAATVAGNTARALSRFRPKERIIAFTPSFKTYNQLALSWGVEPQVIKFTYSLREFIEEVKKILLAKKIIKQRDKIIITAGYPFGKRGQTDLVKVEEV